MHLFARYADWTDIQPGDRVVQNEERKVPVVEFEYLDAIVLEVSSKRVLYLTKAGKHIMAPSSFIELFVKDMQAPRIHV